MLNGIFKTMSKGFQNFYNRLTSGDFGKRGIVIYKQNRLE